MIGAFAAIGALLAGTAPLAGLGKVESNRIGLVVAGACLGLVGVVVAIVATTAVLVPRTVYAHELQARSQDWFRRSFTGLGPLEDILAKHPESVLPPGIRSPAELEHSIAQARLLVADTSRDMIDPAKSPGAQQQAGLANGRYVAELHGYLEARQDLLLNGRFEKARTGFRVALPVVVLGGLLAAGGLGLLLYGLNDKASGAKTAAETAKLRAETRKTAAEAAKQERENGAAGAKTDAPAAPVGALTARIALTTAGQALVSPSLGAGCDLEALRGYVLGGDAATGKWDVLTIRTDRCRAVRFTVTSALGTLTTE